MHRKPGVCQKSNSPDDVRAALDRQGLDVWLRQLGASQISALGAVSAPPMELSEDPDGLIRITVTDQGLLEIRPLAAVVAHRIVRLA